MYEFVLLVVANKLDYHEYSLRWKEPCDWADWTLHPWMKHKRLQIILILCSYVVVRYDTLISILFWKSVWVRNPFVLSIHGIT